MKILFFVSLVKTSSGNIFGGAEKTIVNLANWFSENTDNEVYLVSINGIEKPFDISSMVNYQGFEINTKGKLKLNYQIYRNIKTSVKSISPDIIITFDIYPLFYSIINTLFNNHVKLFFSERNDPKIHYSLLQRMVRDFSLFLIDGVVFQTQEASEYFSQKIKNKGIVIHNPVYIQYERYPVSSQCDNRIVAVGRLSRQKNYELLIDAFKIISVTHSDLVLEIYGEGEDREALQTKINTLNLDAKVFLKGVRKNVIDLIYGARMFIMTSRYEGMPNALMEAMCLGIPVVCSDCPCGGPRELITTGDNGFLFENDNIEDLINKINACLSADRVEIGKKEKNICVTHSVNNIFTKWYNFILSKIKRSK